MKYISLTIEVSNTKVFKSLCLLNIAFIKFHFTDIMLVLYFENVDISLLKNCLKKFQLSISAVTLKMSDFICINMLSNSIKIINIH